MPKPTLHIGTSGYAYKEWKGSFYPADLPAKQMLGYYGERFGAVEINASFYRLPTAATLTSWATDVPADFSFAFKSPQRITHFQRLKDSGESVAEFVRVAATLKERLGPLLFGLPPNMKKDVGRLRAFLELLPRKGVAAAFEFRHASWFDNEVFDALRVRNAALCIADDDNDLEVPFEATANWGYLRLRRAKYTVPQLRKWAERIQKQDWREAFVFFKHEETGTGPRLAKSLAEITGSW